MTTQKEQALAKNRVRILGLVSGFLDDIDSALVEEERKVVEKADKGNREIKEQEHGEAPALVHRRAPRSSVMPRKVREELDHQQRKIETK